MRLQKARFAIVLVCIKCAVLAVLGDSEHDSPTLETENDRAVLPDFLGGQPEDQQAHIYSSSAFGVPHTASGEGLHQATAGVPTSFTIQLVGKNGTNLNSGGILHDRKNWLERFIYVWIANEDQIMIAEVQDSGRSDGVLTASFTCDFPGEYLVHVEEVEMGHNSEGSPIKGSPFSLVVAGPGPTLNVDSLPVCDSPEDPAVDGGVRDTFWRPGTWLSSRVASAAHGVTRDGWVFQPKTCVFDAFSREDLMLLAAAGPKEEEPTWLLVLGGSVQRGVFLSLVDMALERGQKAELESSAVQKCWGYANVRIGNLRLTYQDMRLYRMGVMEDSVVCNDEKLVTGSTSAFVHSSEEFLNSTVFRDGDPWPSVILAPSNVVDRHDAPNLAVSVLVDALPASWEGKLMFVDHLSGFGLHWSQENPTMTGLRDVGMSYHGSPPTEDSGVGIMQGYQSRNSRVSFMSVFPMYQAKLFENQNTRNGIRKYGSSQHFHYVSRRTWPESYNGAKLVQSTITEMLAHIMIGKAVGTKTALYEKVAHGRQDGDQWSSDFGETIEVCHDCPQGLVPFHVKPVPDPNCTTSKSLPGDAEMGEAWNGQLCPGWCMEESPVSQTPTESGPVDVRKCRLDARRHNAP